MTWAPIIRLGNARVYPEDCSFEGHQGHQAAIRLAARDKSQTRTAPPPAPVSSWVVSDSFWDANHARVASDIDKMRSPILTTAIAQLKSLSNFKNKDVFKLPRLWESGSKQLPLKGASHYIYLLYSLDADGYEGTHYVGHSRGSDRHSRTQQHMQQMRNYRTEDPMAPGLGPEVYRYARLAASPSPVRAVLLVLLTVPHRIQALENPSRPKDQVRRSPTAEQGRLLTKHGKPHERFWINQLRASRFPLVARLGTLGHVGSHTGKRGLNADGSHAAVGWTLGLAGKKRRFYAKLKSASLTWEFLDIARQTTLCTLRDIILEVCPLSHHQHVPQHVSPHFGPRPKNFPRRYPIEIALSKLSSLTLSTMVYLVATVQAPTYRALNPCCNPSRNALAAVLISATNILTFRKLGKLPLYMPAKLTTDSLVLVLDFTDRKLDALTREALHEILTQTAEDYQLELPAKALVPSFFYRMGEPQLTMVYNHQPSLESPTTTPETCHCGAIPGKYKMHTPDTDGLHLATADLSFIYALTRVTAPNTPHALIEAVIARLQLGPHHRFANPLTTAQSQRVVSRNICKYLKTLPFTYPELLYPASFGGEDGVVEVVESISTGILDYVNANHSDTGKLPAPLPPWNTRERVALKALPVVWTRVEKSTNDFFAVCPVAYWRAMEATNTVTHLTAAGPAGSAAPIDSAYAQFMKSYKDQFKKFVFLQEVDDSLCRQKAARAEAKAFAVAPDAGDPYENAPPPSTARPSGIYLTSKPKHQPGMDREWLLKTRQICAAGHSITYAFDLLLLNFLQHINPLIQQDFDNLFCAFPEDRKTHGGDSYTMAEQAYLATLRSDSWVLPNSTAFVSLVTSFNAYVRSNPDTATSPIHAAKYDFSNLYHTLPHIKFKQLFHGLFARIKNNLADRANTRVEAVWDGQVYHFRWTNDRICISNKHTLTFDLTWFEDKVFDFVLDNIGTTCNGKFFTQHLGIPMGYSSGVVLANVFLSLMERAFLDQLIAHREWKLLACFKFTGRYIDDIPVLSNPYFDRFIDSNVLTKSPFTDTMLRGMYDGTCMTLNLEDTLSMPSYPPVVQPALVALYSLNSSTTMPVLDVLVKQLAANKHYLTTRVFDKRSLPKYGRTPLTRFPAPSSLLPRSLYANITTSELHRMKASCNMVSLFLACV